MICDSAALRPEGDPFSLLNASSPRTPDGQVGVCTRPIISFPFPTHLVLPQLCFRILEYRLRVPARAVAVTVTDVVLMRMTDSPLTRVARFERARLILRGSPGCYRRACRSVRTVTRQPTTLPLPNSQLAARLYSFLLHYLNNIILKTSSTA